MADLGLDGVAAVTATGRDRVGDFAGGGDVDAVAGGEGDDVSAGDGVGAGGFEGGLGGIDEVVAAEAGVVDR